MSWPLEAARGSSPREAMESASASEEVVADVVGLDLSENERNWVGVFEENEIEMILVFHFDR